MKERTLTGKKTNAPEFGRRLAELRKARGLTQADMAEKIGVSRRVIAYYESEATQPPGPILLNLAQVLDISVDQLLGRKAIKKASESDVASARLLNRLRKIESLPMRERKAILLVLDGLLANHHRNKRSNAPNA